MSAQIRGQLDMLDLLAPPPPALVAPRAWTPLEFHPDDFDAADKAHNRWAGGNFKMYQGWTENQTGRCVNGGTPHPTFNYHADIRCNHFGARSECHCVGGYYYRTYCAGCEWWTPIAHNENESVELQLDHCWPGWRDLPLVESLPNAKYGYDHTIPKDYPEEWKVPGAPMRQCRGSSAYGTRHVPTYSAWGGYGVGVRRECKLHDKGG